MKEKQIIRIIGLFFISIMILLNCKNEAKEIENEHYFPETVNDVTDTTIIYDIVILNGRVINPETNFDEIDCNIGIIGETIKAITKKTIKGKTVINAEGLVVSPGFIDLLTYDPADIGAWVKIADGVTSNILMHGGSAKPQNWYSYWEKRKPPVNFGASFFVNQTRMNLGIDIFKRSTKEQLKTFLDLADKGLAYGALGVSFSLEYAPGNDSTEIIPLMKLAAKYNAPTFFHVRYSDMEEPGTNIDALKEVMNYARKTGAAIHIDHINSTGGTFSMKESIALLQKGRDEGLDITACVYPYNFWGTYLNSTRFSAGWQKRFRISYNDLQIAGTKERLTAETFKKYQKQGKLAVAYAIPEEDVIDALKCDFVMIGSDAILETGNNNHPRASGAYARTIAKYVRTDSVLTLMQALRKMTLQPAQRMEKIAPDFLKKGRLAIGADADITIFDYNKIQDMATVEEPHLQSKGIEYVLVGGKIVKDKKGINKSVRNGKPIRSKFYKQNK